MSAHQRYLEAPYVAAAAMEEAYEKWCDDNELDSSDSHWAEFEKWCDEAEEDHELEIAEAQAESRWDEE